MPVWLSRTSGWPDWGFRECHAFSRGIRATSLVYMSFRGRVSAWLRSIVWVGERGNVLKKDSEGTLPIGARDGFLEGNVAVYGLLGFQFFSEISYFFILENKIPLARNVSREL